jgi:hypothetical protein
MKRSALLIFLLMSCVWAGKSQYFSTGEDPASLKWKQIVTPDFQLIFPEDFEEKAKVVAGYFQKVYEVGGVTLNHRPRRISIIFHTRTIRSNGLVGWAPRRMELFTPPHQEIYAQDWLQQLALHEFRHVVQVDKIHSQVPKIVKALLGEQGVALITGLYLPFWFIEGDAVIAETALSRSGRGRLPSFLMEHQAQVVEKGVFSFDKAFNGSYRDYIPDHYKLGYYLVGGSRAKYGSDLWNYPIGQLAGKPLSVTPVNKMLKKRTGKNQEQIYSMIFDSLKTEWLEADRRFFPENLNALSGKGRGYTQYRHNHFLPSGEVISLKSGYDHVPRFVRIDDKGHEETVYVPGQIFEESVGYQNNLVVWSEYLPDLRWSHSGKSWLRLYNLKNQKLLTITPEYKCFAPSISPDEHNLAVVETDFDNHYYLTVYDARSGELKVRYQTPGNHYLFSPVWKNKEELVAVLLTDSGKRLALLQPFRKQMEWIDHPDMGEIRQLKTDGYKLWFISSYSGKNELWSMDLGTKEIFREARARFGLDYPAVAPGGQKVVLSDYSSEGYRLVVSEPGTRTAEPLSSISAGEYRLAGILANQEPGIVDFTNVDTSSYKTKSYKKGLHLFNVHSWAPASFNTNSYELSPGISLASQNKLGTAEATIGYKWNMAEQAGRYYLNFEYRGFYPLISVEAYSEGRGSEFGQITEYKDGPGSVVRRDTVMKRFTWGESGFDFNVRMPFNLTRGRYFRLIQPELRYSFTAYNHRESTPEGFISGNLNSLAWRLYFHQLSREAYRDLQPRLGWIAEAGYHHTPFGSNQMGTLKSLQFYGYLPGLARHHGISAYLGAQEREKGAYRYGDAIRIPRGWNAFDSKTLVSATLKYSLPLFYPDYNLGKLIYLRRFKAALFYDYAWFERILTKNGEWAGIRSQNISSIGTELTADSNLLRFYAPVQLGARMVYMPGPRKVFAEILFSVDFTSF